MDIDKDSRPVFRAAKGRYARGFMSCWRKIPYPAIVIQNQSNCERWREID
jgi:hypothetical protein